MCAHVFIRKKQTSHQAKCVFTKLNLGWLKLLKKMSWMKLVNKNWVDWNLWINIGLIETCEGRCCRSPFCASHSGFDLFRSTVHKKVIFEIWYPLGPFKWTLPKKLFFLFWTLFWPSDCVLHKTQYLGFDLIIGMQM